MSMAVLPACKYVHRMPGAHRGLTGILDLLRWSFWKAVSHLVGARS